MDSLLNTQPHHLCLKERKLYVPLRYVPVPTVNVPLKIGLTQDFSTNRIGLLNIIYTFTVVILDLQWLELNFVFVAAFSMGTGIYRSTLFHIWRGILKTTWISSQMLWIFWNLMNTVRKLPNAWAKPGKKAIVLMTPQFLLFLPKVVE